MFAVVGQADSSRRKTETVRGEKTHPQTYGSISGSGPRKTKPDEAGLPNLPSDSFVTNDQLKEEINQIEVRMNNVDEQDFEERSDQEFSNIQSQV